MRNKLQVDKQILQALVNNQNSNRQIAKQLNCSEASIRKYIRLFNILSIKNNGGAKEKLSKRTKSLLVRKFKDCSIMSAQDGVSLVFETSKIKVSKSTIRNCAKVAGLVSKKRQKKPLITPSQLRARKIFYKTYKNYSYSDFKNFIFSDESSFQVRSSSYQKTFYGSRGSISPVKSQIRTLKFGGGSLMVWGYITFQGVGRLYRINGTVKSNDYCRILETTLLDGIDSLGLRIDEMLFVQDNAPCHSSRETKEWLRHQRINPISWPPNSPDMNIIENVWGELKRAVQRRDSEIKNKDTLWTVLQEEFYNIKPEYIRSLYKSMPRRIKALKTCMFQPTKY